MLDIISLLTQRENELLDIDIDMLAEELDTGDYPPACVKEGKDLIEQIRLKRATRFIESDTCGAQQGATPTEHATQSQWQGSLLANRADSPAALSPYNDIPIYLPDKSKQIENDLQAMRRMKDHHQRFRTYLAERSATINEQFIDEHINIFNEWELGAIVSTMPLSEDFLEKHLSVLDPVKVSQYQTFSEEFFIHHYSQLDAMAALTKGKNPWRAKERMSQQLSMFLRLKGIRI